MALAAGVTGEIHTLGEAVHTTQARYEHAEHFLFKMGGFINEDHISFCALVVIHILFTGTVPEEYCGAVAKVKLLLAIVISAQCLGQQLAQRFYMVCSELRV